MPITINKFTCCLEQEVISLESYSTFVVTLCMGYDYNVYYMHGKITAPDWLHEMSETTNILNSMDENENQELVSLTEREN